MTFQGDLMNLCILQTKTWTAYRSKQQKKLKKKIRYFCTKHGWMCEN